MMNQQLFNSTTDTMPTEDSKMIWLRCSSNFRRSQGDLINMDFVDPAVEKHMNLPPIVATLADETSAVHYFPVSRDDYDSDSESVECIVLPSSLPFVPLQRDHSTWGGNYLRRSHSSWSMDV